MKAFLLLLLLSLQDYVPTNIESFAELKGSKKKIQDQTVYMVDIPKDVFSDLNKGRKLAGKSIREYEQVKSEPFYNKEYLTDWINYIHHDLSEILKRDITEDEVFIAFLIGQKAFSKLDYNIERIKDETVLLKLELFRKKQQERSRVGIHEAPPPLPSDGRPLVPRRYESERASYK